MFTVKPDHQETIKRVVKAASSRNQLQIFECILIDAKSSGEISLKAGDSVQEVTASLFGDVELSGMVCVNASKFLQAVTSCKFDCKVSFGDGDVTVKSGRSKFTLKTFDADTYPSYPDEDGQDLIECDSVVLCNKIAKMASFAPDSDVRFFLNGVHVGGNVTVTNGHRLIIQPGGVSVGGIVPTDTAKKIPTDIIGQVFMSKTMMTIKNDGYKFKTKLIDGNYPDAARAVGKPDKHASVDVDSMREAIKAAMITVDQSTPTARIIIDGDSATIQTVSGKQEKSIVEFSAQSSDQIDMAFNAKYLLDAISFYAGEIELGFTANQLIIDKDGIKNVVMMVRV